MSIVVVFSFLLINKINKSQENQYHLVDVVHTVLCPQISFGGLPVSAKPNSGGRDNFVGCMEGITYNGENITNLVRRKKVDTSSFVRKLSDC